MRFGGLFTREGRRGKGYGVRREEYEGIETKQKGKGVIVARARETKGREAAGRKPRKKESGYERENGFRVPGTDASKKRELSRFDNSQNVKVSSELRLTRNFQLSGIPERLKLDVTPAQSKLAALSLELSAILRHPPGASTDIAFAFPCKAWLATLANRSGQTTSGNYR